MQGIRRHPRRRARIVRAVAAVAVAAVVTACAPGTGADTYNGCTGPSGPPNPTAATIYQRTNSDRAAGGLGPLRWNPQLWCLANEWSGLMALSGNFQHRDLNVILAEPAFSGYHTLGENLLRGSSSLTGDQMENAWMASPDHRANILSPAYDSMAVSFAYSNGVVYATENFGG
jgi:uncharacterized protein YkwD